MAKIILDAGHGGNDLGGVYGRRYEKDDNLKIALAVGELLKSQNNDIVYTRVSDEYISQLDRVNQALEEEADLFVTFHRSNGPYPNVFSGARAILYKDNGNSERHIYEIILRLKEIGFTTHDEDILKDFMVLRDVNMPSLLIDVGYIDSDSDNEIFDDKFDETASAIAAGILDLLDTLKNTKEKHRMEIDINSLMEYQLYHSINITKRHNHSLWHSKGNFCYRIQMGLYRTFDYAMELQYRLISMGLSAQISRENDKFVVSVGSFKTIEAAADLELMLRRIGYNTLLIAE